MGLFSDLINSMSKDYSDGVKCPVCNSDCYWDNEKCKWICKSCKYEVTGTNLEYDEETGTLTSLGIDWFCDGCGTYLNDQSGFDPYSKSWKCTACGYKNKLTKDNII